MKPLPARAKALFRLKKNQFNTQLKLRVYYYKKGKICHAVLSARSEVEAALKMDQKGIHTKDIHIVECLTEDPI